ncbi:MAG: hypothetical protein ACFFBC_09405, partial [Promethearchaeota archaeon]
REIQSISEELEYKQEQFEEEAYVEEEEIEEREIKEKIYPENLNPPATSVATKKVKVGGFFGKEIEIKLKKELETQKETQQPISEMGIPPSITNLKPPRKRGTGTIKLCKICGATLQSTNNCPMCGAKVD